MSKPTPTPIDYQSFCEEYNSTDNVGDILDDMNLNIEYDLTADEDEEEFESTFEWDDV